MHVEEPEIGAWPNGRRWASASLFVWIGTACVIGSAALAPSLPTRASRIAILALWNAGNAAVIAGVLVGVTLLVDAGGVALVIALVLALRTIRHSTGPALARRAYWLLAAILAVSIPTGLVLARLGG